MNEAQRRDYWRRNLRLMAVLLSIWALVSFGAGILFVEPLNEIDFFGFPLGFWFAQQGSIITFVAPLQASMAGDSVAVEPNAARVNTPSISGPATLNWRWLTLLF